MNVVYNTDCVEAMKEYPDGYFDLVVADPPYGINITGRHRSQTVHVERERDGHRLSEEKVGHSVVCGNYGKGRPPIKTRKGDSTGKNIEKKIKVNSGLYPIFDDKNTPGAGEFNELKRISKKLIIWGGNYFLDYLGRATCMIVWDKKRRGMSQADCEIAWTNLPGQSRIFEWRWNGMLQQDMKHKEKRIHATQKPVALYKYLFSTYCKEGDKILDPYLGSGSSRIAAYDLGFDFVGYEIEKVYFDLQEKRFAEHTEQTSLFAD